MLTRTSFQPSDKLLCRLRYFLDIVGAVVLYGFPLSITPEAIIVLNYLFSKVEASR